jgi:beta-lactamase class D
MRWKRSMQPLHQDDLSTLGFMMLHVKHTWSSILAIVSSWMEQSMLISLSEQVGLLTSMLSLYMMKGTSSSGSK